MKRSSGKGVRRKMGSDDKIKMLDIPVKIVVRDVELEEYEVYRRNYEKRLR